jgi:uncharacterized cupredoxin-like copper-binding protein
VALHQGRHVRLFLPDPRHREAGMFGTILVEQVSRAEPVACNLLR